MFSLRRQFTKLSRTSPRLFGAPSYAPPAPAYSTLFDHTLHFQPRQCSENDVAKVVLIHEPGVEALLGSLHASGSLFEKPVNLRKAREGFQTFSRVLSEHGIQVLNVRDVLAMNCERDLKCRMELEDLAIQTLKYVDINKGLGYKYDKVPTLLSNEYKRQCLAAMGVKDLVDIILINPTVYLQESKYNTPMKLEQLQMKPMLNLTFTRDQQLVTNKGIVITNMGAHQRDTETTIIKFCLEKLGLPILGKIHPPGTVEGGDFIAGNEDLCFIGSGLRTNFFAIKQMLDNNWFGTRRVAVVRDIFDCNQQRMHLDTIFNIASDNCAVMLESVMGKHSDRRRLVTEYTYNSDTGRYSVSRRDVEFSQYVREQGYHIIPISEAQQEAYGINFLNIGENSIIGVDESTARTILEDKNFVGNIECIDFSGVTTMYGSVHCCSQVLLREPRQQQKLHMKQASYVDPPEHLNGPAPRLIGAKDSAPNSVLLIAPSYNQVENHSASSDEEIKAIMASRASSYLKDEGLDMQILHEVRKEFSDLHKKLIDRNIKPIVVTQYVHDDAPWATFPNHVLTTHSAFETQNGKNLYIWHSIKNEARRKERKQRIRKLLNKYYEQEVKLYENHEGRGRFLEGSASMVFDRSSSIAFTLVRPDEKDPATNLSVADDLLQNHLNYALVKLEASKECPEDFLTHRVLYVGDNFAVACLEALNKESQESVKAALNGKQIIKISLEQAKELGTSMVLLGGHGRNGHMRYLMVSSSAWEVLSEKQRQQLNTLVDEVVPVDVKITEERSNLGLDSMICPLFLSPGPGKH